MGLGSAEILDPEKTYSGSRIQGSKGIETLVSELNGGEMCCVYSDEQLEWAYVRYLQATYIEVMSRKALDQTKKVI
jgi:hypothetical protein